MRRLKCTCYLPTCPTCVDRQRHRRRARATLHRAYLRYAMRGAAGYTDKQANVIAASAVLAFCPDMDVDANKGKPSSS